MTTAINNLRTSAATNAQLARIPTGGTLTRPAPASGVQTKPGQSPVPGTFLNRGVEDISGSMTPAQIAPILDSQRVPGNVKKSVTNVTDNLNWPMLGVLKLRGIEKSDIAKELQQYYIAKDDGRTSTKAIGRLIDRLRGREPKPLSNTEIVAQVEKGKIKKEVLGGHECIGSLRGNVPPSPSQEPNTKVADMKLSVTALIDGKKAPALVIGKLNIKQQKEALRNKVNVVTPVGRMQAVTRTKKTDQTLTKAEVGNVKIRDARQVQAPDLASLLGTVKVFNREAMTQVPLTVTRDMLTSDHRNTGTVATTTYNGNGSVCVFTDPLSGVLVASPADLRPAGKVQVKSRADADGGHLSTDGPTPAGAD